MAERIDSLTPAPIGRPPLYPWAEWMDGSAWRIKHGEDFQAPATTMAVQIRRHASRHGVSVKASVNTRSGTVEFQFSPAEPTEKAA